MSDKALVSADSSPIGRIIPSATARIGIVVTLTLLLIGFVSVVWTPYPVTGTAVGVQLMDPTLSHPFGTDPRGRDILSLTMKGLLTSYVVAGIAVAIGLLVGVPLGLAAAAYGGWVDRIIGQVRDTAAAIPALVLAAILATNAGPGAVVGMAALGFAAIPVFARVARDSVRPLLARDDVGAARLAGFSPWEAATRHVFPAMAPLIVTQSLSVLGFAVLAEAALSYAGLTAQPDSISLGLLLREAQSFLMFEPHLILPGIAAVLAAAALHLAADGVRKSVDADLRAGERDDALA
jgi:peptide/nickel transport system permease protein